MKLLAAVIMVFSVPASDAAFGQAGLPSASDAPQTSASQDAQRIKVTRIGKHSPTEAPAEQRRCSPRS